MSKLKAAFKGAVDRIFEPHNLIVDAVLVTGVTALSVVFGSAAIPALVGGTIGVVAYDAVKGAYQAVKNHTPQPT